MPCFALRPLQATREPRPAILAQPRTPCTWALRDYSEQALGKPKRFGSEGARAQQAGDSRDPTAPSARILSETFGGARKRSETLGGRRSLEQRPWPRPSRLHPARGEPRGLLGDAVPPHSQSLPGLAGYRWCQRRQRHQRRPRASRRPLRRRRGWAASLQSPWGREEAWWRSALGHRSRAPPPDVEK
jgi:hypothetical protein